ncbi:AraC family transcriptional regulator, partial [Streptococcus thermophilus]|nr:AraC family transcriptional regulator [Streptococcus thermophilus]
MLFEKENVVMVLSYDFERLMVGQQTTYTDFKH